MSMTRIDLGYIATNRPGSLTSMPSLSSVSTPPTSPLMGFDPEMLKNMNLGAPEDVDTEMLGTVVLYPFLEMQLNATITDRN